MRLLNPWCPLPLAWWYTPSSPDRATRLRRGVLLVALILVVPMIPAVISASIVMEVEDVRTPNMKAVKKANVYPKPGPEEERRRRITFTYAHSQWYDYPHPIGSPLWDNERYTFRHIESRRIRWFQRFSFLAPSAMGESFVFSLSLLFIWGLMKLVSWRYTRDRADTNSPGDGWLPLACHSFGYVCLACAVAAAAIWILDAIARIAFAGLWSIAWWQAVLTRNWAMVIAACLVIAVATVTLIRSDRARRALPIWRHRKIDPNETS
jgi:hypothetical protein